MGSYVAFDVSLRSTSVHVVDEAGKCLWRGKCASERACCTDQAGDAPTHRGDVATWCAHIRGGRFQAFG
jgi:hypothetical protein